MKPTMLLHPMLLVALLGLTACGGGGGGGGNSGTSNIPPPTFGVDPNVLPTVTKIPGVDGGPERELGSAVNSKGHQADFVLNELVVSTDDTASLNALIARWGGSILNTIDFTIAGLSGIPKLHLVRVDTTSADTARLAQDLRMLDPDNRGHLRFSSDAGLKLLAIGAQEGARGGMSVSLNWVLYPTGIPEGTAFEAPTAAPGETDYTPNAFDWPYMNRGSAQDIGVGAAWQALAAAGRLGNRVKIMVIDGGFLLDHGDYPSERSISAGGWGVSNPWPCSGGSSCPWHGAAVANAAMGRLDNNFGSAGPAGPVARFAAVQSPSPDFFAYVRFIAFTLSALITESPKIINISAGGSVPALGALFLDPILSGITTTLRAAGILVFASAGNEGINVDAEDCGPLGLFCWEEASIVPCEATGVICVGGMGWDTTARAGGSTSGSNFGTRADGNSVDIYGPYTIWGTDPSTPDNLGRKINGTSFASPFAAGVAALVWAANPGLAAGQVWDIMRGTAHIGGVHGGGGNQHRLNAFGAVRTALGGAVPPFVRIDRPRGGAFAWRNPIAFNATAFDVETGGAPTVSWNSNRSGAFGPGGTGFTFSFNATSAVGNHTITATASVGGRTGTDSVSITVQNSAPVAAITQPANAASVCRNETVNFAATVADPNNPPAFPFPASGVAWSFSGAASGSLGTGFTRSASFSVAGGYTITVRATDELGAVDTRSIGISVVNCTDTPPIVTITNPADAPGGGPDVDVFADQFDANGQFINISLQGSATDAEDGVLSGAALVWRTDRGDAQPGAPASGPQQLGTGASLIVKLYTNCTLGGTVDHQITLTATDSNGNARSATRLVRIRTLC